MVVVKFKNLTWAYKLLGIPSLWRSIIACDIEWFKEVTAATLSVLALGEGFKVCLVDESTLFRVEILENVSRALNITLDEKLILLTDIREDMLRDDIITILLNPKNIHYKLKILKDKPFIMLHYKQQVARVKLEKIYCSRVSERIFTLRKGGLMVKVEARVDGVYDASLSVSGPLKMVLNSLQEALVEYGPLTVSDAITVISGSLKVNKSYARKLLYELVRMGFIKIEGKNVLIA